MEHNELHEAIANDKPLNNAYYAAKSSFSAVIGRMATYTGQVVDWDKAVESNFNLMPEELSFDAMPNSLPDEQGDYALPIPGQTKLPWA